MRLIHPDYFVAAVAIVLGMAAVLVAVVNHEWSFRLKKARWVERRWGRTAARLFYATLGIVLIALGILIAT